MQHTGGPPAVHGGHAGSEAGGPDSRLWRRTSYRTCGSRSGFPVASLLLRLITLLEEEEEEEEEEAEEEEAAHPPAAGHGQCVECVAASL